MEKPSNRSSPAGSGPTVYVQADKHTFRDLVQRLTGSSPDAGGSLTPSSNTGVGPRRFSDKLQARRGSTVGDLVIRLAVPSLLSQHSSSSPSISSPVTPLTSDPLFSPAEDPEERAIADKGFYIHPSHGGAPLELLPLFPMSSPSRSY